jgi:hypothetical protein
LEVAITYTRLTSGLMVGTPGRIGPPPGDSPAEQAAADVLAALERQAALVSVRIAMQLRDHRIRDARLFLGSGPSWGLDNTSEYLEDLGT